MLSPPSCHVIKSVLLISPGFLFSGHLEMDADSSVHSPVRMEPWRNNVLGTVFHFHVMAICRCHKSQTWKLWSCVFKKMQSEQYKHEWCGHVSTLHGKQGLGAVCRWGYIWRAPWLVWFSIHPHPHPQIFPYCLVYQLCELLIIFSFPVM